jgi:hypothetical protein
MPMGPTMNSLNNNVIPTLMPQISDPKIIVQTFNAPNSPILPNSLPQPKVELNLHLPKQNAPVYKVHTRTIIRKENPKIKLGLEEIKESVEEQFEKILKDKDPTHSRYYFKGMSTFVGRKPHHPSFEILTNPTDRLLFKLHADKRIDEIMERIRNLKVGVNVYQEEVASKLRFLSFLQKRWQKGIYSIIV